MIEEKIRVIEIKRIDDCDIGIWVKFGFKLNDTLERIGDFTYYLTGNYLGLADLRFKKIDGIDITDIIHNWVGDFIKENYSIKYKGKEIPT